MPSMTEATVLAVIKSKGVFQLNPLAYRNERAAKLLKAMTKKGLVKKQRVNAGLTNYTLNKE